jgi:hypothetical protein
MTRIYREGAPMRKIAVGAIEICLQPNLIKTGGAVENLRRAKKKPDTKPGSTSHDPSDPRRLVGELQEMGRKDAARPNDSNERVRYATSNALSQDHGQGAV